MSKGFIDKDDFFDAIERCLEQRVLLGELAIETNTMSSEERDAVLRHQEVSRKSFGTTAVEHRYMTATDLALLLLQQSQQDKTICQALLDLDVMDAEVLDAERVRCRMKNENAPLNEEDYLIV